MTLLSYSRPRVNTLGLPAPSSTNYRVSLSGCTECGVTVIYSVDIMKEVDLGSPIVSNNLTYTCWNSVRGEAYNMQDIRVIADTEIRGNFVPAVDLAVGVSRVFTLLEKNVRNQRYLLADNLPSLGISLEAYCLIIAQLSEVVRIGVDSNLFDISTNSIGDHNTTGVWHTSRSGEQVNPL